MLKVAWILMVLLPGISWSQMALEADPFAASFFARNISASELKDYITILSSPAIEGRETGSPGQEMAAEYIIGQLKEMGVQPHPALGEYGQPVVFTQIQWEKLALQINGQSFEHLRDYVCFTDQNHNLPHLEVEDVLYINYGIDDSLYSDYRNVNARGRTVLIFPGEPMTRDSLSLLTGTSAVSDWSINVAKKLRAAYKHKVRLALVVDPDLRQTIARNRHRTGSGRLQVGAVPMPEVPNTIHISPDMAKWIIGEKEEAFLKNRQRLAEMGAGRPMHLPVKMVVQQHLTRQAVFSKNIIGILPGNDPLIRDEYLVISAHYDHLGKKGNSYFPGADDNASGTSAVLEIMETLSEATQQQLGPRRNVMCIFFTAEEKGLLGSQYYADHPLVPFEQTVANVNIDMIGRTDEKHQGNGQYIYVIGSDRLSTELHQIHESVNSTYSHLNLDYTYNERNDPNRFYYRSDHYHFAKNGVPSIFFFSGVHEDYHKVTDTPDKILFPKYEAVTRHIFHLVWELANRRDRIKVDVSDDTLYER